MSGWGGPCAVTEVKVRGRTRRRKRLPVPLERMEKGVPFLDREKEKEQWKKLYGTATGGT